MQGLWVSLSGSVGGIISWILTRAAGTNPLGIAAWYFAVGANMLIGAVCAFFVIYFILPPFDASQLKRILALSLAAGIFWQPVLDGMKRTVSGIANERTSDKLQEQKKELQQTGQDPGKASSTIKNTTQLLLDTVEKTKHIDNLDQKQKLERGVEDVISTFPAAAKINPVESYQALSQIGVSSINKDQRAITSKTLDALEESAPQGCKSLGNGSCKEYMFSIEKIQGAAAKKSWSDISDRATRMTYLAGG